ncbi:MAG: phosphotriesterase [Saprospiraceae bacterium]|nr:phosphotriesterase [Saprospiraceae bacterium]
MRIFRLLRSVDLITMFTLWVGLLLGCGSQSIVEQAPLPQIMTIRGLIPADSLGKSLIHEHVFLDWSVADSIDITKWNNNEAFQVIIPFLEEVKEQGVRSFFECTPAYLGRNPELLLQLTNATGLQIVTNTGYYAARNQQHVPGHVTYSTPAQIASIWIDEFNNGIDGMEVKPGFIKIGVDSKAPLDSIDRKVVRAAAITHRNTGLTIVGHTGTDTTAAQQLSILAEEGVDASAFVWTHAQRGTEDGHIRLARRGVWISLDGLGWVDPDDINGDSTALLQYVAFLQNLKQHDLLNRTLISHDAGWYTVGQTYQGDFKPYTPIFNHLIPTLLQKGFDQQDFRMLLVDNPAQAYALKQRLL